MILLCPCPSDQCQPLSAKRKLEQHIPNPSWVASNPALWKSKHFLLTYRYCCMLTTIEIYIKHIRARDIPHWYLIKRLFDRRVALELGMLDSCYHIWRWARTSLVALPGGPGTSFLWWRDDRSHRARRARNRRATQLLVYLANAW